MSLGPKILTIDIETGPTKAYVWGLWNQNIGISQIIEPTRMICFAAKWLDSKRVIFKSEFHDNDMVQTAFDLLSEADAVVTYNGDSFDLPHLQREFLEAGLGRPAPFVSLDLYKVTKKNHRWISNKLAWVTERLALTGKLQHQGFELWEKCLAGDPKAWAEMRRYNKQDAVTTEELYCELLPWIDNHPTFALYVDDTAPLCPRCGSNNIQKRGYATTKVSRFQRYQCQACGTWARGGTRVQGVNVR